jgi:hypothetical protein
VAVNNKLETMTNETKTDGGTQLERDLKRLVPVWTRLFKQLKQDIGDDYRASDDPFDTVPGMQVTIGFTPADGESDCSWSYQTGDNSYTGGAYGHRHWAVVSLYRRSNSRELAEECAAELSESVWQDMG